MEQQDPQKIWLDLKFCLDRVSWLELLLELGQYFDFLARKSQQKTAETQL
jgi:hypothetical protein